MSFSFSEPQVYEGSVATITGTVPASYAGQYVFWKVYTLTTFASTGMVLVPAPGTSGEPPVPNDYCTVSFTITVPYTDNEFTIANVGISTEPGGAGTGLGNAKATILNTAYTPTLAVNKSTLSPGDEIILTLLMDKAAASTVYIDLEGAAGYNMNLFYEVTPYALKPIVGPTLPVNVVNGSSVTIKLKTKVFAPRVGTLFRFRAKYTADANVFLAATSDVAWAEMTDLVAEATLSPTKNLGIGDTISIGLSLSNFEGYKLLHPDLYPVSSINKFKFLINIEGSSFVTPSHFMLSSYSSMTANKEIEFLADDTKTLTLTLDNLTDLVQTNAPYTFTVIVRVLWPSPLPVTILSSQVYTIPSSLFPAPFTAGVELATTDLYIEKEFNIKINTANLVENLEFTGSGEKSIGLYIQGLEPDSIRRFDITGPSLNNVYKKPSFFDKNDIFYHTDSDGNIIIGVKLDTTSSVAVDLNLTVTKRSLQQINDSGVGGLEDGVNWLSTLFTPYRPNPKFKIYIVDAEFIYKSGIASNHPATLEVILKKFLGSSDFINIRLPKVDFLPSYLENELVNTTISGLDGYEAMDLYWKALLIKGSTIVRTLEVGSTTISNGAVPISFSLPAVLDETLGVKVITNGVSNFEFPRQPVISNTYEFILNKPDDTVISLDKVSMHPGDDLTLTISSHNLGTSNLSIESQGLALGAFSRQMGLDLKPLETSNTVSDFNGDLSIPLKLTNLPANGFGVPFRFAVKATLGNVTSVIGYSSGCVVPIPPPFEFSIDVAPPVGKQWYIGETLDIGILVNNAKENLMMKGIAFANCSISILCLSGVVPFNDLLLEYFKEDGTQILAKDLAFTVTATDTFFAFKLKLLNLKKAQYIKCPLTLYVTVNGGVYNSVTDSSVTIPKPTIPALDFKTLIYNRSNNNKTYAFSESVPRQSNIFFEKISNVPEESVAICRNTTTNPVPSSVISPILSDHSLTIQPKFNPTTLNSIDQCSFEFDSYAPYVMLNVTNLPALDGNYIISLDSDYINQNNIIFNTMTKASNYNHIADYRCLYLKNTHPSDSAIQVGIYIADQPSAKDVLEVGLDPSGKNGTAAATADTYAAPSGVTFSKATYDDPLVVGVLLPGQSIAFWIKRYSTSETEAPAVIDVSRIAYKALV